MARSGAEALRQPDSATTHLHGACWPAAAWLRSAVLDRSNVWGWQLCTRRFAHSSLGL